MKYILFLLSPMLFIGCVSPGNRVMVETPSVAKAGKSVRDAKEIAKGISEKGTAAKSPESAALIKRLGEAEAQLVESQAKIDSQAADYSKSLERLNYIEPKYAQAVGILWKWRLICFGIIAAVVGFFVARQYFPFLKIF